MPLRRIILIIIVFATCLGVNAQDELIVRGRDVTISLPKKPQPVLTTALELFRRDIRNVFDDSVSKVKANADIAIAIDPDAVKQPQGFRIKAIGNRRLLITAHDSHGAAYGLMELSRMIGVSPWEWWADVAPRKRDSFSLPKGYQSEQSPSVEFRGIFINDEDWGLMPWSSKTYEPSEVAGRIGPKTNARIFELLLRLKANTFWPAMHECSVPFFLTNGNRETAQKYGIYIGGSHCEPMACSTAGEWPRRGKGEYNYASNRDEVLQFWTDRVKEVAGQEIVYTIGMRGLHDGAMKGFKGVKAQKNALENIFQDQRSILRKYVNKDISKVPQVFIPYKEVLDVYNSGLTVPDDVTLMWCDDNYGYIRHLPDSAERNRKGGNGIYYHVSYWGRPHDYLWLSTTSPYLIFQQMRTAYDNGIRKMWILNVGDIKPAEYQTELFLDMAWNIKGVEMLGPKEHLHRFLARDFGKMAADSLLPVMDEYYRLAFIRRPEFMGNTRVEERNRSYWSTVRDLPCGMDSLTKRERQYKGLSDKVERLFTSIPENRKDAYFELVKYPVQAAAQMNRKLIYGQMARHGLTTWAASDAAYDSIQALTRTYNAGYNNEGKWNRIMDCQPRKLPVFARLPHVADSTALPEYRQALATMNGSEGKGKYEPLEGLGYAYGAVQLYKDEPVVFALPAFESADSISLELCFLPTHPIEKDGLIFSLLLDGKPIANGIHYETHGRSEEWKENVLANRAIRRFQLVNDHRPHTLTILPKTKGIVLDQIIIR